MEEIQTHDYRARIKELERQNEILKGALETGEAERNDFLTSTLNTMGDPVFVKDSESRLLLVNNAFCEIFHLSREDIIGKTLAENVPPEERDSFLSIDHQVLETGIENINEESLTVEGEPTHIISTKKSRFIDSKGNRFLVGIIRDISERIKAEEDLRMSEQQFRSLFTQSLISSAIIDLDHKIINCNDALCEFLGFSEEELLGKSIEDFCHPSDTMIGQSAIRKVAEGQINSATVEKRYIRKDGSIRWGEKSVSLIRDKQGEPIYMLPVIQDITGRYLALQSLKESQLQLKELNDTKDKMFSIISHDLRSPICSIISYSSLLSDESIQLSAKDEKKFTDLIETATKNTLKLLDSLLGWANIQRGNIKLDPIQLSLQKTAQGVIKLSESAASLKFLNLENSVENLEVFTDRNILDTILLNLTSNAIKFTEPGGKIVISAEENSDFTLISVTDNGVGMTKDQCNRLFNISTNTSSLGTAKEKGSGLGLILCKDFVLKLGGEIWVESELGRGTTFTFSIPKNI